MSKMHAFWITLLLFGLDYSFCDAVCKNVGRFPDNSRTDCRGYVMCLQGATDMTQYNLVCPESTIYSHIESQCTNVTGYQCLASYPCPQQGNFVYDLSTDCTAYIECVKDLNNLVTGRIVECPEDTIFSVIENMCVNSTLSNCFHQTPQVYEASSTNDVDVSLVPVKSSGTVMFMQFLYIIMAIISLII